MNIYFSGIIGVGKTTLGEAVAARLKYPFDDLDRAIERQTGKTIGEVVATEGWLRYRELEYQIAKIYARKDRHVIALAGGTPRYEWNRDVLRGSGINILLVADLNILPPRVGTKDRPRVNPVSSLIEDLERIWKEYKDVYTSFSDFIYRTDQGKSVEEEMEDILGILQCNFPQAIEKNKNVLA
jgi:shikimate kinase